MICKIHKEKISVILEKKDLLSDYKRWLRSYLRNARHREVSKNSLILYNRILNSLESYIQLQKDAQTLKDIDQDFFLSFLEYLEDNSRVGQFSTKTKVLYISILKSFFVYVSDNNDEFYTYEKEFKGLMPKKANRTKKVNYLSDDEVTRLVNHLNNILNKKQHYSYVHSLGIKLMLFAGLRVSEVLNLKLENIKISDIKNSEDIRDFYEIHLKDTKSKEEQVALIKISNIEKELEYFREFREEGQYFFTPKKNQVLINRSNFYVTVSSIMKKLDIRAKGLHILRHTCAMQLFRKTGNLLVLKETLRHSDIKTTMIYAHAEKRDIADAMR
jgi:integrase/recombinase XerD